MAGTDFSHLTTDELIKGIKALDLPDYIRSKAYGIDVRETLAQMTEMTIQLGVNMGLSPDEALKWARKLQESVSQSEFDSWVATLLDGGPSIFMNTLNELKTKYPNGAPGVALVRETDPAKIYVWTGSAWEDFGDYQGIVVADGSITSGKIADEAIGAEHFKYDLRKKLNTFPNEIISGSFITSSNHASGAGKVVSTVVYMRTEKALLKAGDTIITNASTSPNALVVATYNLDGTFKGEGVIGTNATGATIKYTASLDEYVVISNNTSYVPLSNFYVEFWNGETDEENDFTEETLIAPQAIRKPVISFIFDDGNTTDADVVTAFKERNFTCGFALPTTVSTARDASYLDYQKDGFEILSHSTNSTAMSDGTTDASVIEQRMRDSKQILENRGFKITGWVTPSSTLHESYLPIVNKYYEYAYTKYLGLWTTSTAENPYNTFTEDTRQLKRVSAESSSQQNLIDAIDKTIADGGMLTIYAHIYPNTLSVATLTTILDYLKSKVASSECLVLTPSNAYKHLFTMRHSDYLNLLNA